MNKTVAVIGSGPAGLAAASLIANKGYTVTVFESNKSYGGKVGLIKVGGSMFDTGPSLLTEPYVIDEVYKICGKNPLDYWQYKKLKTGTKYFWGDGINYQMPGTTDEIRDSLINNFSLDAKSFDKYMNRLKFQYRKVAPAFLDEDFKIYNPKNIMNSRQLSATLPFLVNGAHQYNSKFISNKNIVQLFDRFATYSGSNPYRGPALINIAGAPEIINGVYYPRGGMRSIAGGLFKLAKDMGVEFIFKTRVSSLSSNHSSFILQAKDIKKSFDKVVYSGDYAKLYDILGMAHKYKKYSRKARSSSGIVFYWEVKGNYRNLGLHNIIFSNDYRQEFDCIEKNELYKDPTIYINITSKQEPRLAKAGHENWFVMLNVPAGYSNYDLSKLEKAIKSKIESVIKKEIIITAKDYLDPKLIQHSSGSYMGAIYGHDSNSAVSAVFKPPNKFKKLSGLYCVGGSVHPGGGVPLSVRSAKIVARQL